MAIVLARRLAHGTFAIPVLDRGLLRTWTSNHISTRQFARLLLACYMTADRDSGLTQRAHSFNLSLAMSSWASLTKKLHGLLSNEANESQGRVAYLYHQIVGTTVPRCHKLCASIMPR